jgi:hypothetical protein
VGLESRAWILGLWVQMRGCEQSSQLGKTEQTHRAC